MRSVMEERLRLHRQFWNGEPMEKLLASFRTGDYFFSTRFKAVHHLLKPGKKIEPSMLNVDEFMEDYERLFHETEEIGQDGFWAAEPFTGIPWMEAILGCPVYGGTHSFISEPAVAQDKEYILSFDLEENPWYLKYMEFTEKLVQLSGGRFPVAQPIMRGPSDMMGALLGQTRLVYDMNDEPEKMKEMAAAVTDIFLDIVERQFNIIPDYHGGQAIGFYHLWTPGKCIWFQEDLSALLSPAWYREFIKNPDMKICRAREYTAVHVHPASFHILDELLAIDNLKAVEVNKDVGGPSVHDMMPVFKKIKAAGKRIMIWGTLTEEDIKAIKNQLPMEGVFLNIVAEDIERARRLKNLID